MKTFKVLTGVVIGIAAIAVLYLINRNWIAPAVAKTATASPISSSGTYPLAPDFSLTDLSGQKLDLSSYRGKVVLLDFWATWCGPCRLEIPEFIDLQTRYRDQGLAVIGVAMDDGLTAVQAYYKQMGMNYRVAVGNDRLGELYGGIMGLPTTFVIGRDGHIYSKHTGAMDEAVFDGEIKQLLATPGNGPAKFEPEGDAVSGNQVKLGDPALINSVVPGIDVRKLTPAQLIQFKKVLSAEQCTCGCKYTILQCRQVDSACGVSLKVAQDEYNKLFGSTALPKKKT